MNQPAKYTADALYNLLPAIYRQRDTELGQPLLALLSVIAEQVGIVQDDIENLYENWFIETCDPWVVPYIGDLVGAILRRVDTTGIVNRRSFVADTISYRRRKGTLLVMEDLTRDITGCGAKAVELFQLLETTQNFNHIRSANFRTPDLRNTQQLELLNTPFDSIAHSLEVRDISNESGLYNVPNVGIFLYRLQALPVTSAPAYLVLDSTNQHFTFDTLGRDTQLFNHPVTESGTPTPTKPTNVPIPITRSALAAALADYYGSDKSFEVNLTNSGIVPVESISVCNLTDWIHTPQGGGSLKVAVDPVLGRIAFSQPQTSPVNVSYYYGFSAEIGGGFYERPDPDPYVDPTKTVTIYPISKSGQYSTIQDAFNAWVPAENQYVIFEIEDSEIYTDTINITLPAGSLVEIRAAQDTRPVIQSKSPVQISATPSPLNYPGASLVINGIFFDCSIEVLNTPPSPLQTLTALTFRHCTLTPGQTTACLTVGAGNDELSVTIDSSITGSIDTSASEATLYTSNSIVDGSGNSQALACYELNADPTTFFGPVNVTMIGTASNSIFRDAVVAKRRQSGCVRFCYIPIGSRVPHPYRCQTNSPSDLSNIGAGSNAVVTPRFTSENYGDPGYAQLYKYTQDEIFKGADDGNEMGAFNSLQLAVRFANLNSVIGDYTRFGLATGVFMVN